MNTKIFGTNFSKKFLSSFCMNMKELTLGPGEILYKKGDILDKKIYFINRGILD